MTDRPRLLYLIPRYPWPPDRGDRLTGWNLLRQFTAFADVTLVAFSDVEPAATELGPLVDLCDRIEVIHHPTWRGRANMLAALGDDVPFQVAFYRSRFMEDMVRRLRGEQFDLIFSHLFRMHPYLAPFNRSRRVTFLADSLAMNLRRAVPTKHGIKRLAFQMEQRRVERYEARVMSEVDESWVVSETDRQDLLARSPDARVVVVPNGVEDRLGKADPTTTGKTVLLLGNMTVGHNIDMAIYLVEEIWPLVRGWHPDAELLLVGTAGPTVKRLASRPGVTVTGFIDDLAPIFARTRVAVAPLRYGAGVQNKVLETMAAGLPAVVTSIVNEGIGAEPERSIDTADDPAAFAASISRHLSDPARAARMGLAGREHILAHFSWEPAGRRMKSLLGL